MEINNFRLVNSYKSLDEAFACLNSVFIKNAVLKEIEKRLIIENYLQNYQIVPEDKTLIIKEFCHKNNINSESEFEQFLFNTKQSRDALVDRLNYMNRIEKLKKIVVSKDDINDAFLRNKARQDSVIFSIIRVKNRNIANELYYRLNDDLKDFGELARRFSDGPEAIYGGIIGPTVINSLNPELRNILLNLKEGEITDPFQIDSEHFLIVKLIKLNQVSLISQVEESIRNELFEMWLERQISLYQNSSAIKEEKS